MNSSSNPNSAGSQQAQTASNVLSGEKSYRRIEFAITGDPMADFIAGVRALQASHYPNIPSITVSHLLRALSDIAKAQHEWETEGRRIEADRSRQYQQLASLGSGWPPVTTPDKTQPYWTSSGGPLPPPLVSIGSAGEPDFLPSLKNEIERLKASMGIGTSPA